MSTPPLLRIDALGIDLPLDGELRTVVHHADVTVREGTAVALVGESGSGKSLTARSVMGLLPGNAGIHGDVLFAGESVPRMRPERLRAFRATEVAMVFQDPRAHINPARSVGDFLVEGLTTVRRVPAAEAVKKVTGILREVGIADAERRMRQRPHELSGGLLQRVMIAAALAAEPRLLLADEPTTALDVTTQEEVMAIIDETREARGLAMLFITHDLELAAAVCDRVVVMYAGTTVEELPAGRLRGHAAHPYTRALLASRPPLSDAAAELRSIPGRPLSGFEVPDGCAFSERCPHVQDPCRDDRPEPVSTGDATAACHFPHPLSPEGTGNHA
ncbi:ABC transporter ATP-binding protein [Streptomyces sp. Amel2xC10]|uniref:ABC transporter ATP-binding protein n=1 Tax=Streptomyces sp. Amel2xC10 TaxID=1305826 RepID=UPI000A08BC7C|nr:ABC transporter ATP-binding protein [Streptomyces sp. Amel2xC10]SMF36200.1 oligopeptide/dipeptide ABC transporter, ATP-binding protein, C-terminal domain-containing protein [Streptomyces sp. Amel2xC10]